MLIEREARDPATFPNWRFGTMDFDYEPETRSAWMSFKADGPPCFTFQTLKDLADIGASLRGFFAAGGADRHPIHYVVLASKQRGIFNLGGDLSVFAAAIRRGDRDTLRAYAHACIDVLHAAASGYDLPIVVVAAISGQALGGGLEAALAHDYLFAEETAVLGVPEAAFNTFPGMGAVTLLTRRIGATRTGRIISSGKAYPARDMHELGVVDRVTAPGGIRAEVRAWMGEGGEGGRQRRLAVVQARRRCLPVTHAELISIVDVWTECSVGIGEQDLRYMDRLVSAQKRKRAPA